MKNKLFFFIILGVVVAFFISEIPLGRYRYIFRSFPFKSCSPSLKNDYDICCKDILGRDISCKDKTTFNCGEKIKILILLSYEDYPYYICVNSTTLPANISCFSINSSLISLENKWGEIPPFNGKLNLLEIYKFQDKNYTNDLSKNIKIGKKILTVTRDIVCQK
jgi:hypothetical protein